ncbi:hypothetical protein, partial [Streptococcus pseudopneumoniae]|uniref:hypothetical protein n=1 Tax=Streptococcus pseudopneumoniae TaxID=257758 RepID=UPI0019D4F061
PFVVSPDGRYVFTIEGFTCYLIEIIENKVIWSENKIFGDRPVCFFSEDGSKIIINDPIIVLKSESGEEIFRLPKERPGYNA